MQRGSVKQKAGIKGVRNDKTKRVYNGDISSGSKNMTGLRGVKNVLGAPILTDSPFWPSPSALFFFSLLFLFSISVFFYFFPIFFLSLFHLPLFLPHFRDKAIIPPSKCSCYVYSILHENVPSRRNACAWPPKVNALF